MERVLDGEEAVEPPTELVEAVRAKVCQLGGEAFREGAPGLRPEVFKAYRRITSDPDSQLATWLETGAPLGIEEPIASSGIFPPVTESSAPEGYTESLVCPPAGGPTISRQKTTPP